MKKVLLTNLMLILCLLMPGMAMAQQREAFPGAEGYGRLTTGGRGGKVYHVTNLNDSGEGSFRAAVDATGTRTIVFDVSGTIFLKSPLNLRNGNVTIAGQTAPGDGICIADYPFAIKANNVIIRFMRFRIGDRNIDKADFNADGADGLGALDCKNIIVDHCSVSWSLDECLSFGGNTNTTVQWCIVSQSMKRGGHSKGNHGYGGNWGGSGASYHHNLLAHHDSRVPRLGPRPTTQLDERMDMRNNVMYNPGGNGCYGGEGMNVNIVNNYYKPSSATKPGRYQTRIAGIGIRTIDYCLDKAAVASRFNAIMGTNYTKANVSCGVNNLGNYISVGGKRYFFSEGSETVDIDGTPLTLAWNAYGPALHKLGTYYVTGNANSKNPSVAQDNWKYGMYNQIDNSYSENDNFFTEQKKQDMKIDTPIEYVYTTTHTAEKAYEKVLAYAGASLSRDALDKIIVSDAQTGKCTFGTNGIIDNQDEVYYGATNNLPAGSADRWPALASKPASVDTDGDGMPDEWEKANGLDPNNGNDGKVVTKDGYTNLEHYINSLVEEIMTAGNAEGKLLTANLEYSDPAVELPEYVPGEDPEPIEAETILLGFGNGSTVDADAPYNDLYTGKSTSSNSGIEWPNLGVTMYLVRDDKKYSGGNSCNNAGDLGKPIKLSNGAPNLIILPDGFAVDKVEFLGYCNNGDKSWIANISAENNGTLETVYSHDGSTSYVNTVAQDNWKLMTPEVDMPCITCDLSKPVTGKLWFKNGGSQPAFYIKLYKADQSGIEDIVIDPAQPEGNGKIYNLMGIEVKGELAPGIYIRDGKKFLVK